MNRPLLYLPALLFSAPSLALVPPNYSDPPTDLDAEVELGMQYNSGNTNSANFNTRGKLVYDTENARQEAVARAYFAADDEKTTAEQYQLQYQSDYKLEGTQYLYGRGDMLWDRFGSYLKQFTYSFGYGYTPLDAKRTKVTLEVGAGYRYNEANLSNSDDMSDPTNDEGIVRLASKLEHRLQEYTTFNADASVETGNRNTIANLNLAYRNQFWADLALKVGFDIKYTDKVPVGTENHDVVSTVNLIYSFR
ncbi:protein of unknown function DUF481 [Ferrimonas balearica DSM 9799]|uniref:Salt-induced outer membrane protein n=2 Tax=Ferrimonas balearica TaxID=44012 RepID=E1SPS5_FERBD|nr:DUF481 domain-containing protein [Ferrimonas balearica]ADN74739.1 protein of unknown function DUF481 [Ferrimonas balearica DSM 9799]MBY6018694.1 DUF481 domain-containing protein [Halomonas denitrificans]